MVALKVINSARERAKCDDRVLWEIWSDGSVDSKTGYGGAGGAIWSNVGVEPFWSKSAPAGMCASSYNAEVHALCCSVETFNGFISSLDVKPDHAVLLVCYSLSLFSALQSDPYSLSADIIPLWKLLYKISTFVSSCEFIGISSHCGIVRSDIVDILARSGTKMDQTSCPLSVSAVKAYINRGRVRESVLKLPEDPSSLELDIPVCLRYIHCALNQIWSGKWSECYDHQFKIGKAGSPFCPTCSPLGVKVVDDVDHRLFRCPRFREVRLRCFGLSSLEPDRCDYVGRNTAEVARFVALARDL